MKKWPVQECYHHNLWCEIGWDYGPKLIPRTCDDCGYEFGEPEKHD